MQKEKCGTCTKFISLGQSLTECSKCSTAVIHTNCYKKSNFKNINNKFFCKNCYHQIDIRYNPFNDLEACDLLEDDSDTFFSENINNFTGNLKEASRVLDACMKTNTKSLINLLSDKSHNMNSYFYNVDGNKTNFSTLAAELKCFEEAFSLIGIAETNIESCHKDMYCLDGYKSFYSDKLPGKDTGTGVAIYVHESFNSVVNEQLSSVSQHLETVFVIIGKGSKTINAGVVYRSPNSNCQEFLADFEKLLKSIPQNETTYILGDFNLNLLKSATKSEIEAFETLFLSEGLYPTISLITHQRPDKNGSCIDNIFTNKIETVACTGVVSDQGSGHSPIFSLSKLEFENVSESKQKQTQCYSFSSKNTNELVEILKNDHISLIGSDPDCPDFSNFLEKFTDAIDQTCKLQIPKNTIRNAINNPWITDSVINSVENKRLLYEQWKNSCDTTNPNGDEKLHKFYSEYRYHLKHVIKFIKNKYYGRKIDEVSGNPKKTWELINQIRGKFKKSIKPQFIINDEKIVQRRVIANEFNKYFVSIASKLNDEVSISPVNSYNEFLPMSSVNSMFLNDCTEHEISNIITELQNGKASDIPISVIKKCSPILSPVLAIHFNYLMRIGKFPDQLKLGKISPIFKKGNEELMENYRPVSTLPIFGKIFEKVIYSRLYSYFVSQGILYDKQFGFRKNHSTAHALNYSVNHIEEAIKNNEHVIGIFIDLSKAFDTIDHSILLKKLEHYGIRGRALSLLDSYLKNRIQIVSVLAETSEPLNVVYGVPQGSCLGPLLFLIYINDLGHIAKDCEIILFADDTNIFIKAKSLCNAYERANTILEKIVDYMTCNKLHINLEKSCYMHFSKCSNKVEIDNANHTDENYKLKINQYELPKVSQIKFLGVIIDNKLSWSDHIKALTKKLSCCIGSLNQIIESIPERLHKDLYHTLFESYLSYGISVWGGCSNTKLFPLFKAQKKVMRVVFGDRVKFLEKFKTCVRARPIKEQALTSEFFKKESSKPLFNSHGFLTLQNLYYLHSCCEIFKIFKYKSPISLHNLFKFSNRACKNLYLITPLPSESYTYRMSKIWNLARNILSLPDTSTPISTVKTAIKNHLLSKQCIGGANKWIELNFAQ